MRFIPHSKEVYQNLLDEIGVSSFEDLIQNIPDNVKLHEGWDKEGLSERELLAKYKTLANDNSPVSKIDSYLGGGAYEHFIPSVVNHLSSLPQFLTSYTQYQAESNQGMLQALFEYQTLMCRLTGMDVSNSSHYDGATSLVESLFMALRQKKGKIVISYYLNPEYKRVLKTFFLDYDEIFCEIIPSSSVLTVDDIDIQDDISAVVVQSPNFLGSIEDIRTLSDFAHSKGAMLIASVNPVSLGLLESPGAMGADIVVGEGQPLGNPLNFGGPYFGFICVKKELMRKIPGRVVGRTVDKDGKAAYVLTLQAREQHIRRERALSNICTNQALCAVKAVIYLSYLGPCGFKNVSKECFEKTHFLQSRLCAIKGIDLLYKKPFFNEFCIKFSDEINLDKILDGLKDNNIQGGIKLEKFYPEMKNSLLIAVTETKTVEQLYLYVNSLKELMA